MNEPKWPRRAGRSRTYVRETPKEMAPCLCGNPPLLAEHEYEPGCMASSHPDELWRHGTLFETAECARGICECLAEVLGNRGIYEAWDEEVQCRARMEKLPPSPGSAHSVRKIALRSDNEDIERYANSERFSLVVEWFPVSGQRKEKNNGYPLDLH